MDPAAVTTPPVQVFANGILLKEVGIVSVDPVDDFGRLPNQAGYSPGTTCKAALSDATFITPSMKTGGFNYCTDLNSDNLCNLNDAVLFTPPIKAGFVCTKAP